MIEQHLEKPKDNHQCGSKMDEDTKIDEPKGDNNSINSANSDNSEPISNIVAGCRPKIKTKPIIIPKSDSKNIKDDQEYFDDIKPLQTRYSYRNDTNIHTDKISTTLPRNKSAKISFESKYKQGTNVFKISN